MGHAAERIDDSGELADLAHLRVRLGPRKLASGVSALSSALASSLDRFQVANDNGETARFERANVVGSCKWTAKDPIRFRGGLNLYAYVTNDPVNKVDPTGFYGTNDRAYYAQRCAENRGSYYCETAPKWCEFFPKPPDPNPDDPFDNEGFSRCTRQCLQDADRERSRKPRNACTGPEEPNNSGPWNPASPSFDDHVTCFLECFFDNSFDWFK